MSKSPYIGDKALIPRIEKYLETNLDKEYISITTIADDLQKNYRDYSRRNRNAFRKSVDKAYSIVLENHGVDKDAVISCSDASDTEEILAEANQSSDLTEMYKNNALKLQKSNDLIEILSEKSDDDKRNKSNQFTPSNRLSKRGHKRKINGDKAIEGAVMKKKDIIKIEETAVSFDDVAGMEKIIEELYMLLVHMKRPEIYRRIGELPPRGILLHGPVGCGKTLLASAIAGELKVPLLKVSAPELVAGVSGESEERIRDLFIKAAASSPCILFIDQIDAITQSRQNSQKDMEKRIVAQLLTCFDDLNKNKSADQVLVIGATNRPDSLDPALRREGRFDTELCLGVPDFDARLKILKTLTSKLKLSPDFNYELISKLTPGYVGADLVALKKRATLIAVKRVAKNDLQEIDVNDDKNQNKDVLTELRSLWTKNFVENENLTQFSDLSVTMDDFLKAVKLVQPSSKREGFATVPDVTWDNVGSLSDVRQELQLTILASIRYTKECKALGITASTGVLLCGPPGCGKTLLAKAIANEAGINFISVKGPELLNMYVGESERAVRQCFARARNSAPCVIFFDELDALCPKRSDSGENGAGTRVVNQMLTEMDGVEDRQGVYILAASNRPEIIDPAVLRPGRLDKILYVGLPTAADRFDILKTITKGGSQPLLDSDVDLNVIGCSNVLEGYTGADLAALVHEASIEALKDIMIGGKTDGDGNAKVSLKHFKRAAAKIRPSVNERDRRHYEKLKEQYSTKSRRKDEVNEVDFISEVN
ncbi:nuclear valosin-containing protein-like [Onthophagus taurus]|uniref:nuclear valosin-containing protein-like n=1 Tax=Onthophagus taurus TaxID=166361 RepID=UPI0039BE0F5A